MDLSHWNLRQHFTIQEAAALAAGIDPLTPVNSLDGAFLTKRDLIQTEMFKSYVEAVNRADAILSFGETPAADVETIFTDTTLPSIELSTAVAQCIHTNAWLPDSYVADVNSHSPEATFTFDRKTLAEWFVRKGLEPCYSFSKRPSTEEPDRPISSRERDTDSLIIAALLKQLGIEWKTATKSAQIIARFAEELGCSVSARTIEDRLKRIPDAIEHRAK